MSKEEAEHPPRVSWGRDKAVAMLNAKICWHQVWEIGNEVYGNGTYGSTWEYDVHVKSPTTYAKNVVAYSQAMKAVDPSIRVGVVLTTPDE